MFCSCLSDTWLSDVRSGFTIFFSVGHGHKRRRIADTIDIEDRLESLITRVGEKVNSIM